MPRTCWASGVFVLLTLTITNKELFYRPKTVDTSLMVCRIGASGTYVPMGLDSYTLPPTSGYTINPGHALDERGIIFIDTS